MGANKKKILFVNSEIYPYVPESAISMIGRKLPPGTQEKGREIRSFMPRYGCVNERQRQLHEVIRLSGMNIILGDVDRPLVIKVASLSEARMQVYFIDNDDYFTRKQIYRDAEGKFFADNGERAAFFARGVLETVKKLRWAPDIIHVHGWISHFIPLYLKKVYHTDPIFSECKTVLSLYDEIGDEKFSPDLREIVAYEGAGADSMPLLEAPDGINLAKTAAQYSDGIIFGSPSLPGDLEEYARSLGVPVLGYDEEAFASGKYIGDYNDFYDKLSQ